MSKIIKGLIIVLGSPNSADGELFNIAKERCNSALLEYRIRTDWKLLLTGGFGEHFNRTKHPHAAYLKQYLIMHGVSEFDFVEFAESTNTLEDASLSKPIVLKFNVREILIVTSDFHLDRAKYIFEKEYSGSGVKLTFVTTVTNTNLCGIDLESQIEHEKESLKKMRLMDK